MRLVWDMAQAESSMPEAYDMVRLRVFATCEQEILGPRSYTAYRLIRSNMSNEVLSEDF